MTSASRVVHRKIRLINEAVKNREEKVKMNKKVLSVKYEPHGRVNKVMRPGTWLKKAWERAAIKSKPDMAITIFFKNTPGMRANSKPPQTRDSKSRLA